MKVTLNRILIAVIIILLAIVGYQGFKANVQEGKLTKAIASQQQVVLESAGWQGVSTSIEEVIANQDLILAQVPLETDLVVPTTPFVAANLQTEQATAVLPAEVIAQICGDQMPLREDAVGPTAAPPSQLADSSQTGSPQRESGVFPSQGSPFRVGAKSSAQIRVDLLADDSLFWVGGIDSDVSLLGNEDEVLYSVTIPQALDDTSVIAFSPEIMERLKRKKPRKWGPTIGVYVGYDVLDTLPSVGCVGYQGKCDVVTENSWHDRIDFGIGVMWGRRLGR